MLVRAHQGCQGCQPRRRSRPIEQTPDILRFLAQVTTAAQLFPEIHMSALWKVISSRGDTHRETKALPYAWSRCKLTRFMGRQSIHGLTDCDFHRKRMP